MQWVADLHVVVGSAWLAVRGCGGLARSACAAAVLLDIPRPWQQQKHQNS